MTGGAAFSFATGESPLYQPRRRPPTGKLSLACVPILLLSACSWLPTAGPTRSDIVDQAEDAKTPFHVVPVTSDVVDVLLAEPEEGFSTHFAQYGLPGEPKISIGDTLSVALWEAAGGTLFGQPPAVEGSGSHNISLPEQVVQPDGAISIPFAGRIPVLNHTTFEIQKEIERRLQSESVQPQAIVSVTKSVANSVTVSGEVVNGARVPLSPHGDRLLDMIAAAGGGRAPVYETFVRLSREGSTATMPLQALIDNPADNIYAWPGDVVTLIKTPRVFEAFGATGRNEEIPFTSEHITLAQALAKANGLRDERADPAGVFVFRPEPASLVAALEHTAPAQTTRLVPVVYQVNLTKVDAFFQASRFPIKDKDVVYVANASANELQKFFQLLGTLTGPIITGIVVKDQSP